VIVVEAMIADNKIDISRLPVASLLAEYRTSLESLNRSRKTISWYLDILTRYFAYLEGKGNGKSLAELGRQELKGYVLYLQNASRWPRNPHIEDKNRGRLSPYSIQGHVRSIKAFWGWLLREGYINENPLAKFPLPRVPENLVKVIDPEQFQTLLAHIDRSNAIGARYYCIMLMLYDSGMRISELTNIGLEELDFGGSCVRVTGKGKKQRLVPLSSTTFREVRHYMHYYRPRLCPVDSTYLFANRDGESISIGSVQQFIRRLARKAGLDKVKVSCHILRHSFATQYLINGANVFLLKEVMGHSSLLTTLKYTHLQPADLQNQHARYSPVAHLRTGVTKKYADVEHGGCFA
jgi:site-specific recombinase XerD